MPGGDRTGPLGLGSRTGRAAGYCAGSGTPGYASSAFGQGRGGRGRGGWNRASIDGGRGWRNQYYATGLPGWARSGFNDSQLPITDPEMEKRSLKVQAKALESELDRIRKRLGEYEK